MKRYLCAMNERVNTLSRLGERLTAFGADDASREALRGAQAANGWFREAEIRRAVEALRTQMLSPERLRDWLAAHPALPVHTPRAILVVMAGNIPLVGFFDLLCVVASGHRCWVKPSAKDTVLVEYMIGLLREIDPALPVALYDGQTPPDAVIATGSDTAVRHFRAQYADVPTLLRGSRQSVAVLSGDETAEQRKGLADDIWAYSGLGCRNVSLVFLPQGAELRLTMPPMTDKYRNNYCQTKALLSMQGTPYQDLGAALAVDQCTFPTSLSRLAVARYKHLAEVETWLEAHDRELQCVVSECVTHPRRVDFGCAQSPALTDYPDAVDVLAWLATLK